MGRRVLKVLVRWVHHSTHEQDGTCKTGEGGKDEPAETKVCEMSFAAPRTPDGAAGVMLNTCVHLPQEKQKWPVCLENGGAGSFEEHHRCEGQHGTQI